ncbi:MAG: hypothetical protein QOE35_567 [Actinomycetota bacterium]|jgi:hypothetical protein
MSVHEWRKRTAGGVVASAIAIGLREALEGPRDEEPGIVVDADGEPLGDQPIEVNLFPDHPELSWVVIRPSLLHSDNDG